MFDEQHCLGRPAGCNYVIHKVDTVLLPNPGGRGINPQYQASLARGAAAPAGR